VPPVAGLLAPGGQDPWGAARHAGRPDPVAAGHADDRAVRRGEGLVDPTPSAVGRSGPSGNRPQRGRGLAGRGDYLAFLGVTAALAAATTAQALLRFRPVCPRERSRITAHRPAGKARRIPTLASRFARASRTLAPSPDDSPVFWYEWHRSRVLRRTRAFVVLNVARAATFSVVAVASGSVFAVLVNATQVLICLPFQGVTAATALTEDRVSDSLDVPMTTPLSTRQLVPGKWRGPFRRVPALAVLPALVVLGGGMRDWRPWAGAAAVTDYVIGCDPAVTSPGLAPVT
jgi:hypothetical protein